MGVYESYKKLNYFQESAHCFVSKAVWDVTIFTELNNFVCQYCCKIAVVNAPFSSQYSPSHCSVIINTFVTELCSWSTWPFN